MKNVELRLMLEAGLKQQGVDVSPAALGLLQAYLKELQKWNRAYNLTSVRDSKQMVIRHFLDSAAMLASLDELMAFGRKRLLDVGAGAGLPGLVLAILRPQLHVTLVDSNGKKTRFMRHVQRSLALENVDIVEARIESLESEQSWPLITSRAFAALSDFIRLTMPLLAADGLWLAMKGRLDSQEASELPDTVEIVDHPRLHVPGLEGDRHLVVIRKKAAEGVDA